MTQRQTTAESVALKVYQKYWESYLKGDLETFSSTIDDRFEMIGTSEGEVCHSKADGIAFYKAQMAEVVGKVEMRNSQITSGWLDPLVLINETCDIYVKTDEGWNFYSKLRLSTLLQETSEGWKIVQQHGSFPDMRVADGETIAIEKISKENLELRDAINRRTIELEQKNRELEVEAALERVRSRSLAMHSSNELNEVVRVLFEKLKDLSIQVSAVGISINIEGSKDLDNYTCGQVESGIAINNYRLPYFDHVIANDFFEAREKQLEFFIGNYSKQEKDSFYEYVIEHTELKNELTEEIKQFIFQSPAYSISVVTTKHTMITLNDFEGKSLSDNEKDILKRFSKVFEQAYIRFLDLQKAEAQAREAQIEAALERVRAKAMAMHSSNELREVVHELRKQMGILGQKNLETCVIHLHDESHEYIQSWAGIKPPDEEGDILESIANVPKRGLSIIEEALDAYNSNLRDYVLLNEGEKLRQWFSFLEKEAPEGFARLVDSVHGNIEELHSYWSFADFAGGSLLMVTRDEPDELTRGLLRRFSNVFGLAYRRFADLKIAEAQAREAQIEAALERVRSRSMAMHKSEELREVIQIVYEQIVHLKIRTEHAGFIMDYKRRDDFDSWIADQFGSPSQLTIPYFDCIYYNRFNEAKAKGEDFFPTILSFEEKNRFYEELFEHIPDFPEESKNIIFSQPGFTISTVLLENVALYIENFTGISFSEEENAILMRFGKVFQQTYTRFLDLRKAEAQAREAQIEAALERVRAQTMSMHSSEDVGKCVVKMFSELTALGVDEGTRFGIGILNHENENNQLWTARKNGEEVNLHIGNIDMSSHPLLKSARNAWKEKVPFHKYVLEGEDLLNYYQMLNKAPDYKIQIPIEKLPKKEIQHCFIFEHGFFYAFSPIEFQPELIHITKRFSSLFEQTYRRYLDLVKAEAQAREAQIEAALEKVRSRTMAMQSSDELADAAYVLFEQLNFLGVTHERINIGIVDEEKNCIDFWVTEQGGQKLQTKFSGRISEPTTLSKSYEAWKKEAKSLVVDLQGEELQSWLKYMEEEIKIPFNKAYLHNRRVQTAGFFSKGMLVVTSPEPLQNEALYLLEKFAGVFDLTYTRFSDLKLAEAQALQAEKDLIEIKIARQKAEEALAELKSTQAQLVQQEKLASLGQLTAGIAHEIKNPLNFVNNFSEVSLELLDEVKETRIKSQETRPRTEEDEIEDEILEDIKANLEKIHEHGSRANSIVTSMLQHSRGGSGKKEPTDLNALVKEYVNLSFHGMRAGKNPINVEIELDLDKEIKEVPLVREDFTRVIINLCNNAFDAMRAKLDLTGFKNLSGLEPYHPKLTVSTKAVKSPSGLPAGQAGDLGLEISVEDNGPGIPDAIKDKIFQPFFTTKPTGQGTGLGLSLSYDIVKAHGGELSIESTLGNGAQFRIVMP